MVLRRRIIEDGIPDEKDQKPKESVPSISYFTLYRFASKCDRFLISISLLATFIAGVTLPYAITLVAGTFQNMIEYAKSEKKGPADDATFLAKMHLFGIKYSCVGVVLFLGGYLGTALMNISAINQVYKIRQAYLRAALNQDLSYYDLRQTGGFASRMADDVIKLEEGIGDKVSALVYSLTIALGCITMAMSKGWKLALLCLTTTPITFLLVGVTGKVANRLAKKQTMASGRASAVAQEALGSIRTVYAFNGQQKELEAYKTPLAEARKTNIKKAMGNMGMVGSLVGSFGAARGAGAQIFHLLDSVPVIDPLADKGKKPGNAEGNIELKNVVFHFPSRPSVPVLKGVSLSVKRGQSVALVGQSGCGKSTIVQLIGRYYDVIDGSICIDGNDVRSVSVRWLRSRIGLVGQEPALFNVSVRENIRYGRDNATDDDIEAAAKLANAHHFIVKLPRGYNTTVGERAASLSGGQKQRIAIARALVRDPLVLLLDEATSALDTASEAKVQIALDKAAEGRTTIVVAHRLSTIRYVDVIYVMKEGNVMESGTHDELIAKQGQYYDMLQLQEHAAVNVNEVDQKPVREESKISQEYSDKEDLKSVMEADIDSKTPKLSFWRVVGLNSPEWKSITIGSLGSIFLGFSMPLFIVVFGDLFGSMSDPDPNKLWAKVKDVAIMCILIGVVMGVSNLIEAVSFGIAGAYLTERLRVRMFAHMLRQQVAYFDERGNSTGALCARLSAEAAYVQGATGQRIGILLQAVGSVGLALALAMYYEWRVGCVALSFLPVIVVVVYQTKVTAKESRNNAKTLENSTKIAVEAVSNIRTVASLGREQKFLEEYMSQLQPTVPLARRSAHCRGLVQGLSRSMFNFVNAAALTYGGHLIVSDGVACQDILITTQSLQIASGQAQNAFTFAPDFQKGINAASRIETLLNTQPTVNDPKSPDVEGFISGGNASFKDVEFSYPCRPSVPVLRGLNLEVESGKTVALVGRSGCGKSTVVQLLQRFYDPDHGVVSLDGYPLPHLRTSEVRSSFGLVSQEPVLFERSIRENIQYGDTSRLLTDDDVTEAARQANIHEFIASLPMGYDTSIGCKGVQLSGGQKQRVAIARSLIRRPKILLLDEATSALDSESEKAVVEALDKARSGRTCITIAHRLSTVRTADVLCVIRAGRVHEAGSHEQLLQLDGAYADLYRAGNT